GCQTTRRWPPPSISSVPAAPGADPATPWTASSPAIASRFCAAESSIFPRWSARSSRRPRRSGWRPTSSPTTPPAGAWPRHAAPLAGANAPLPVTGWGPNSFSTAALERSMKKAGVELLKYRPEVSAWQFRSHRLRRLHRKLCQIDHRVAFVGGINIIDDMNTPGHTPPRLDFAVSVEGPLLPAIAQTMQRVWALVQLVQVGTSQLPLFPERGRAERAGTQTARFIIRDNLRHRRDIEQAYLAAIRASKREIVIANSYFFPGITFRRELVEAIGRGVAVTLVLQA